MPISLTLTFPVSHKLPSQRRAPETTDWGESRPFRWFSTAQLKNKTCILSPGGSNSWKERDLFKQLPKIFSQWP